MLTPNQKKQRLMKELLKQPKGRFDSNRTAFNPLVTQSYENTFSAADLQEEKISTGSPPEGDCLSESRDHYSPLNIRNMKPLIENPFSSHNEWQDSNIRIKTSSMPRNLQNPRARARTKNDVSQAGRDLQSIVNDLDQRAVPAHIIAIPLMSPDLFNL